MSKMVLEKLGDDSVGSFDTVIIFCEGVLSKEGEEIAGSTRAIETLKKSGKRILFFSGESASSRQEIGRRMQIAGYDVKPSEIIWITALMAEYLKNLLGDKKIYTVGPPGITEELNIVGMANFGSGPDILTTDLATFVHSFEEDRDVGAVVVGFDEHFSYPKMLRAASYLSNPEVALVANVRRSKIAAAMVACIETCSEKKAMIFDDSPSLIERTLVQSYRISPDRTLIVGPGNNELVCLTAFDQFKRQLSIVKKNDSSFDDEKKIDESTNERILYAESLTEIVSRLKI